MKTMKNSVKRLEVTDPVKAVVVEAESPPIADDPQLAREAAGAYDLLLKQYLRAKRVGEPLPVMDAPTRFDVASIAQKRPEDVTFRDIEELARVDPEASKARWEAVKAASREDLDSGWIAGRALEVMGGSAWERAAFLAIRDRLRQSWPPRQPGEALLIDEMAQYEMLRRKWIGILARQTDSPFTLIALADPDRAREPQTLNSAQSCSKAMQMIERLQRLYQNSLRTFLNIRREKVPAIFQRSSQVNFNLGPQLNVSVPTGGPEYVK